MDGGTLSTWYAYSMFSSRANVASEAWQKIAKAFEAEGGALRRGGGGGKGGAPRRCHACVGCADDLFERTFRAKRRGEARCGGGGVETEEERPEEERPEGRDQRGVVSSLCPSN